MVAVRGGTKVAGFFITVRERSFFMVFSMFFIVTLKRRKWSDYNKSKVLLWYDEKMTMYCILFIFFAVKTKDIFMYLYIQMFY